MRVQKTADSGFSIAVVIIISTVLLIIGAAVLQTVSIFHGDSTAQYRMKLAEEAAEAGAAYATACLERYDRIQTWGAEAQGGPRPNLTPASDCMGDTSTHSHNQYVYTDDSIQTRFEIDNLEESKPSSAIISVTGYAETKRPGTSTVLKTYTHVMKKTIVWSPELTAQRSGSGTQRSCGLLSYDAYCWGTNVYGQLGDGTTENSIVPVQVVREPYPNGVGNHKIIDIVVGSWTNCLLIETGEVYCWGRNNHGNLGIGSTSPSYMPKPAKVVGLGGHTVVKLGVSSSTFCALTSEGNLFCWGSNVDGQVGNNSNTARTTPVLIGGPDGGYGALRHKVVTGVSENGAFNNHLCAIADGQAYCWGRNVDGQIGNNPSGSGPWPAERTPVAVYTGGVLAGKTVTGISGDGDSDEGHTCAMAYSSSPDDTKAYCWGDNSRGILGNDMPDGVGSKVPTAVYTGGVLAGKTVTEIATTAIGGCVVAYPTGGSLNQSRAYCWGGHNTRGDGGSGRTNRPVAVNDPNNIFTTNKVYGLVGGAHRACAIVNNKNYCWGANGMGQIGDGTTITRLQPTESLFLRPLNNAYIF